MGLSFTNQQDEEGAALIILYDGRELERQRWQRYSDAVTSRGYQVYLLDIGSEDGEEVRDFYDISIESLPTLMLVRDNDEVAGMYQSEGIPEVETIIYELAQIG